MASLHAAVQAVLSRAETAPGLLHFLVFKQQGDVVGALEKFEEALRIKNAGR